jgi:SAM-dependent methyltransferase
MIERCRLCGSSKLSPWMTDGHNRDLVFYRCGECSLWNYDLDCGVDQEQYTEVYISPFDTEHKSNRDNRASWEFLSKYADSPRSIMDIGCGNGCLLHLAREAGWTVKGMELSADAAKNIGNDTGIDVTVANFLEYDPSEGEQYDVVVLRHVLEHLPDSVLAMQKINGLLKDNGLALLEFPNTGSLVYWFKRIRKNRGLGNKKFSPEWRPGHVNEHCRKSFEFLLNKTDFGLVKWRTYSSKPASDVIYSVLPISSKVRAIVQKRPTDSLKT